MPKNRRTLAATLLAAALLVPGPAHGAPADMHVRYSIEHTPEDQLPASSVISIVQTHDGYLWLGTYNGLVRFNGAAFKVFDESNTPGLDSSQIVRLFEDSQGNLWIGTQTAGAAEVKDGRVISLDIGRGSTQGRLMAACEDAAGSVWLYTADGQLCRCRNGQVDVFRLDPDLVAGKCRVMAAEKSGLLWVGSERSLRAINPQADLGPKDLPLAAVQPLTATNRLDFLLASRMGGHWRLMDGRIEKWKGKDFEYKLADYPWTNNVDVGVYAACEDLQGNLIVGTLGQGVFWFDAEGKSTCLSTNDGLSDNKVTSLQVDHEGSLWVGTASGGLNRVKRQLFDTLKESEGSVVYSVSEDKEGGLWFSSSRGGADYFKDEAPQHFDVIEGTKSFFVRTMFVDRNETVWAGTWGQSGGLFQLQAGQFWRVPGTAVPSPEAAAIYQDRSGRLWVGTDGGLAGWNGQGWQTYTATTAEHLSAKVVGAIADDAEGNLWVGTYEGLDCLRAGRFVALPKKDGLPIEHISSLYVDKDGVLWIGTEGRGLARFHDGRWTSYTTTDGLISNSIGYLIEDGLGYLWMGSNAGLMRAPKKALNDFAAGLTNFIPCHVYGKDDGLPTIECTSGSQPAACAARDGRLWFPTTKGLASVDPAKIIPNTNPPPVLIEAVWVEDQELNTNGFRASLPDSVTLSARQQRLDIQYASLDLSAADRVRFKYRLEGHETAWTPAGNTRIAHYTKLPHGNYHFHVIACNEDGVWNEEGATLGITVLPPFWQKAWFLGVVSAALLGMIVGAVHYFSTQRLQRQLEGLRQQQALEKERARIARDIHDQVGASLTQVSLLGEMVEGDKDDPAEVEAHAKQISQTARETSRALDEIVWTVNPSNDTLDGLINYICKYAQEYLAVANLRYRLDVPPQLPATPISPEVRHNAFLAAKEAITNVVKHARASSAWIRLQLEPGTFTLEIQDDGRGPGGVENPAAQTRNGLRNMRKRMEDVGGSFTISPAPEGGTLVRLTVPVAKS